MLPSDHPFVIACCIEQGPLEQTTVRMIASLRQFGGALAGCPVVAVQPRRGAPIAAKTVHELARLDAQYVRVAPANRYAWHVYLNKYFALREAERLHASQHVAWFDSDLLVVDEISGLAPAPNEDFLACPRDKNIGTSGPEDPNEAYWVRVCTALGLEVTDLPYARTEADGADVRLYWNAGLFVYRRDSGFLERWLEAIERILDTADAQLVDKAYWTDQVVLGPVAVAMGARWRHLPQRYNYGIASHFREHVTTEGLRRAAVLHYHDSMSPEHWEDFLAALAPARPDVVEWLRPLGPVAAPTTRRTEAVALAFRTYRSLRRRLWTSVRRAGISGPRQSP